MAAQGGRAEWSPSPDVRRALAPLLVDPASTAIVTDFDGTLAPIVDDPAGAEALEGSADLLALLAHRFGTVAVVSGRSASFLAERLVPSASGARGRTRAGSADEERAVRLVGLYGLEWSGADGVITREPGAEGWGPVVDEVAGRLRSGAPPGVEVELKGLAVTVHWRRAPQAEAWVAGQVTIEAERTGLRAHPGRMSVELRAALHIDKGTATRGLVEGCSAACFFGDDLGDLPAFAALADLAAEGGMATVAVAVVDEESAPGVAAAADVCVSGPAQALAVLGWLCHAAEEAGGR